MLVEVGTNMVWGDIEEDDAEYLDFLLPPKQIVGPDDHRVKNLIEYKFNDDGDKVKRGSWPKFGDAVHDEVGAPRTMVSFEEIFLDRPKAPGAKQEDTKAASNNPFGKAGAVLMVCRTCGKKGDHWTSRCPYKDLAQPSEGFVDKPPTTEGGPSAPPTTLTKGAYVPPSMRPCAERVGTDMRRRNEENSVRVTNLSEDTREADLHELFRPFGHITRLYVAIDQRTGLNRGFGLVNFANRDEGERAINKLNGYGYDSLILRVEWSAPRTT